MNINYGETIRYHARFDNNQTGTPFDPTTITYTITKPDGTTLSYVYGTDAEVVRGSAGRYYVDLTHNQAGYWYINADGSGEGAGGDEYTTFVRERRV